MSNEIRIVADDEKKVAIEWTRVEVVYYDLLLKLMEEYCVGAKRARTKEFLWETVIQLWDRTIEGFEKPAISWFRSHHQRFNLYCSIERVVAVLHSSIGIYIAETDKEVNDYRNTYNRPYLRGVARANNERQRSIMRNKFGWLDALRVMVQPLIPEYAGTTRDDKATDPDPRPRDTSVNAGPSVMRALTPKQARFAELVVAGHKMTTAYRMAYSAAQMQQPSVRVESSRLAALPHVAEAIEWLRANCEQVGNDVND